MEDYDEYDPTSEYYASLEGPAVYGTHQASQRLRGPARREQTYTFIRRQGYLGSPVQCKFF